MKARAWMLATGVLAVALAAGGMVRAAAQGAADDLTVVKRAVAQAPAPAAPAVKPAPSAPRSSKPQWFKVRVVDKGSKKGRVTVNLPLALVRAFGDAPFDWRCGGDEHPARRCSIKVADVLEALEAGQELVEVDDENSIVKIWVE
ncbi:MAG TPA: hypothetical protein VGN09_25580 [Vicinamibacteria bacterium]|jgi:hypothetical protein